MEFAKTKELRDQSEAELEAYLIEVQKWLFEARNKQRQEDQVKEISQIHQSRKCIARIKTILNEKCSKAGEKG